MIVDGDMDEFPADTSAVALAFAVAGDAMTDFVETAELFDVDMDHLARLGPLVAADPVGRFQGAALSDLPKTTRQRQRRFGHSAITPQLMCAAASSHEVRLLGAMNGCEQSIHLEGGAAQPSRKPAKKSKKRIDGQREMLLPISGKKEATAAVKAPARSTGRQRKAS